MVASANSAREAAVPFTPVQPEQRSTPAAPPPPQRAQAPAAPPKPQPTKAPAGRRPDKGNMPTGAQISEGDV